MEELFNQVKVFFEQNPHYAYVLIAIVFLVLGIGNFKNKDWAIDPANTSQKINYEFFGRNAFRLGKGVIYILGFLGCLVGFFSSLK